MSRTVAFFVILVVGLLAMGGALQADFYMDDFLFILNDKGTAPAEFRWVTSLGSFGSTAVDAKEVTFFQLLPSVITMIAGALFPMNPVAAHVCNLLIHLILSVLVYFCGKRLFDVLQLMGTVESRQRAALIGALIFASHPLGTEPVHYAKCHMVQLVALFGFWATCEAAAFIRAPSTRTTWRFLLATGLCIVSYFPGTVLLGINLIVLFLFAWNGNAWPHFLRYLPSITIKGRPRVMVAAGLGLSVVGYLAYYFLHRYYYTVTGWGGEVYPIHIATQGRVFWEYAQRIFIPSGLCSDHFQPWSTFGDPETVLKLVLLAALLGFGVRVALGKGAEGRRGAGLLFLFALIPFLMRFLYVNMEIMVEYRAYNALPWIGLLAGCGFVKLGNRIPSAKLCWLPAAGVVLLFVILSAQRSRVWQSAQLLAEDSLARYPLNNRGRLQLQLMYLNSGEPVEVLKLHEEAVAARERINQLNTQTQGRVLIDPMRSNLNLIASYQFAVYANERINGSLNALHFADAAIATLKHRLPASFETIQGEKKTAAWPLLEVRELMAGKSGAAGSPGPAGVKPAAVGG